MSTIKPKTGPCIRCPDDTEKPLVDKFHCQSHYWIYRAEVAEEKKKKRAEMNVYLGKQEKPKVQKSISKVSAKQMQRLAEYRKVRDEFMKLHPTCQAKLSGCIIKATDLHHSKGRTGDLLTDKRYFKALCRKCHGYVETHPNEAKELGLSNNRL